MTSGARIELRDLQIDCTIGTYGPDDVVPDAHVLDLTLTIAPHLVMICADEMAKVFDYDPLIARIDHIARSQKFETQEYLMSLIVRECAGYPEIEGLEISLCKSPVLAGSGSLGVRLTLTTDDLAHLRNAPPIAQ